MSKRICQRCKNKIADGEHHVLWREYKSYKDILENHWFHKDCILKWFDEKSQEKINKITENAKAQALAFGKMMLSKLEKSNSPELIYN